MGNYYNRVTLEQHIKTLLPRLSKAYYALVALSFSFHRQKSTSTCLIRVLYFRSIISYGVIFWGTPQIPSVFKMQKRAERLISGATHPDNHVRNFSKNCKFPLFIVYLSVCYFLNLIKKVFQQDRCLKPLQNTQNTNMIQFPIYSTTFF